MILRLSAKLARKLKVKPDQALPAASDPLADWSATVERVERLEYLLLASSTTLFAVLFTGAGITTVPSFLKAAKPALARQLAHEGLAEGSARLLALWDQVSLSSALNRQLTASMNLQCQTLQWTPRWDPTNLELSASLLNHFPMTQLGATKGKMDLPFVVMARLLQGRELPRRLTWRAAP